MTSPAAVPYVSTRFVACAWIASIVGFVADGVGTQIPEDETTWADNGYVLVPTNVGGSPSSTAPIRKPVCQVECWGTIPGSRELPWDIPEQLAEQILRGTYDRQNFGRLLTISQGGVQYPYARVISARVMTEPRRIWSDAGDYAGAMFDLAFQWIQVGEVVP